jgi:phospholipid N-methyltransferase
MVALMSSFNAESTTGTPIKITIECTGLLTNNTAKFTMKRSDFTQIAYRVQFVCLLMNHAQRRNSHIIKGYY